GSEAVVGDEPPVLPRAARNAFPGCRVAGWGEDADEDLRPGDVEVDHWGYHRFAWRGATVSLGIPGRHVVTDALLALAVAEMMGVDAGDAAQGASAVRAGDMRSEVRRVGSLTLLVDCYNANPQSVRTALDVLRAHGREVRRVAVLGTMLELGERSDALHDEVLAEVVDGGLDLVVATGAFARAAGRTGAGGRDDVIVAEEPRAAYTLLRERLEGGEVVLLKASRGVALEGLLSLFEEDFGEDEA
ncbi:MAG TPA: cyanophycin synthetase, partial [Longimicrobiales bacterium]|nr:cyanophycin synthetase [Longimicrobiales bacterium]